MTISIIAGVAENNCIGIGNTLPWHIPEDLAHFKKVTQGKPVLMGSKTWESLPEKFRPLPGRTNIVIAKKKDYVLPEGVLLFNDLDSPFKELLDEEIFIIGGGSIYAQMIGIADTLYITHIHRKVDGDVFFPEIDSNIWKETEREDHEDFSFVTYKRK